MLNYINDLFMIIISIAYGYNPLWIIFLLVSSINIIYLQKKHRCQYDCCFGEYTADTLPWLVVCDLVWFFVWSQYSNPLGISPAMVWIYHNIVVVQVGECFSLATRLSMNAKKVSVIYRYLQTDLSPWWYLWEMTLLRDLSNKLIGLIRCRCK